MAAFLLADACGLLPLVRLRAAALLGLVPAHDPLLSSAQDSHRAAHLVQHVVREAYRLLELLGHALLLVAAQALGVARHHLAPFAMEACHAASDSGTRV